MRIAIALYHHLPLILLNAFPVMSIQILWTASDMPCMAPQMIKFQLAPCQKPPSSIVVNRFRLVVMPDLSFLIIEGSMKSISIPSVINKEMNQDNFSPMTPAAKIPAKNKNENNQVANEPFL